MKQLLPFCVLLFICFSKAAAQRLASPDSNKYRINLPDFWKPGNKIWRILTDKLPLVCEELKDKELCGDDCNPGYTIEFEMSDPVIFDYFPNHISSIYTNNQFGRPTEIWDIQTSYGFECSLLLRNEKGVLIKRLILVDTNETWKISNRVTLNSYAPPPAIVQYRRRSPSGRYSSFDVSGNNTGTLMTPTLGQEGETPYSYINRNKDKLIPVWKDLFAVVDSKINSW